MWYVAATAGLFVLGAYLGRNVGYGVAIVFYLLAFACLLGMRFAVRSSAGLSVGLLFGCGLLMGLALAPTLDYNAGAVPQALWQAGAATALLSPGSALPATPPAGTSRGLPGPASGRWR
jgi:hypothetical protein